MGEAFDVAACVLPLTFAEEWCEDEEREGMKSVPSLVLILSVISRSRAFIVKQSEEIMTKSEGSKLTIKMLVIVELCCPSQSAVAEANQYRKPFCGLHTIQRRRRRFWLDRLKVDVQSGCSARQGT